MVCPERSGASERERELDRPKLHNFELPCLWGRQRLLRCKRVDDTSSASRFPRIADEEGIDAVREKLTLDLKKAATKMKDAILGNSKSISQEDQEEDAAAPTPPWNLRTRRAACREPPPPDTYSPPRRRLKFAVGLSRREVEEDFAAILGQRPPRRPRKRARIVQKQLDSLFPGLWLSEVSEDMYKVAQVPDNGKKQ